MQWAQMDETFRQITKWNQFFIRRGKVGVGRRVRGDPGAAPQRAAAREDPRARRGGRPEDGEEAAGRQRL